jgi:hypothetical protein
MTTTHQMATVGLLVLLLFGLQQLALLSIIYLF